MSLTIGPNASYENYRLTGLSRPKNEILFGNNQKIINDTVKLQIPNDLDRRGTINEIVRAIRSAKNVAILTHVDPDLDAAKSASVLKDIIGQQKNIQKVETFITGNLPEDLGSLEDTKFFKQAAMKDPGKKFDLVIAVDCPTKALLREAVEIFNNADKTIKIDHHPDVDNYAQINFIDEDASAAAQLVKSLIKPLNVELTPDIANKLTTGIFSDTFGLRVFKDPVKVFKDCMDLAKTGIDVNKIIKSCTDRISKASLSFYPKALEKIKFSDDGLIAYLIEDKGFKKTYPKELQNDKDSINNIFIKKIAGSIFPNIEGVKIGLLLREQPDGSTKVYMRGNDVIVNDIAAKFGGGGHKHAAACIIPGKPEAAIKNLLEICTKKLAQEKQLSQIA